MDPKRVARRTGRFFRFILLFAGAAGAGVLSAQVTTKFKAERERLQKWAMGNMVAAHFTEREIFHNRDLNPFAAPAVAVQKVVPGSNLAVTLRGDFPAGTVIISERDEISISGAALSTTTYSARLTIPLDGGPGFVRIWGFTPLGIAGPTTVALVDTLYRFDLKSPNGYTIKVSPAEKTFRIENNNYARVKYQGEFYKPGEAKPFETLTGEQTFSARNEPHDNGALTISLHQSTTSPEAEMDAITAKMNDPKTTTAERNALLKQLVEVQQKMMEAMTKAMQTDPASLNKKQDDFGCGDLLLYPSKGGLVEGRIACGKNFNGGELKVSGTMTQVK